jgi:hypothetical protein
VQPERWKVFQVLPVGGQNDGAVDDLLIDAAQFRAFVDRHASLADNLAPIAEDNDAMTAWRVPAGLSRDPLGRPRRDRRDPQALPRPRRGLPQLPQHRRGPPLAAGRLPHR